MEHIDIYVLRKILWKFSIGEILQLRLVNKKFNRACLMLLKIENPLTYNRFDNRFTSIKYVGQTLSIVHEVKNSHIGLLNISKSWAAYHHFGKDYLGRMVIDIDNCDGYFVVSFPSTELKPKGGIAWHWDRNRCMFLIDGKEMDSTGNYEVNFKIASSELGIPLILSGIGPRRKYPNPNIWIKDVDKYQWDRNSCKVFVSRVYVGGEPFCSITKKLRNSMKRIVEIIKLVNSLSVVNTKFGIFPKEFRFSKRQRK